MKKKKKQPNEDRKKKLNGNRSELLVQAREMCDANSSIDIKCQCVERHAHLNIPLNLGAFFSG